MSDETINLTAEEAAALHNAVSRIVTSGMRLPESELALPTDGSATGASNDEMAGPSEAEPSGPAGMT